LEFSYSPVVKNVKSIDRFKEEILLSDKTILSLAEPYKLQKQYKQKELLKK